MYIINTTFVVEPTIERDFRSTLKKFVISERHTIAKILSDDPEAAPSYAFQVRATSENEKIKFITKDLPETMDVLRETFGENFLPFTTVLELVK